MHLHHTINTSFLTLAFEDVDEGEEFCELLKELLHVRRKGHCPMFSGGTLKPSFQELLTPTQEPKPD